ncbi:ROK family protein, partial [Salmonella enterica]|uniref:ROK family protein n=1 Tax=Salmonella enterica TaxID=28901 RepID=UPI000AB44B3D
NIWGRGGMVMGVGMGDDERRCKTVPSLMKSFVVGGEGERAVGKARHGDSGGVRGAAWLWPLA